MPLQEANIMNVLYEAQRIRNSSSNTKVSTPRSLSGGEGGTHMKKAKSKEQPSQLLVEPPKHAKRVTFSKQRPQPTVVKDSEMQTGLTSCLITHPTRSTRIKAGVSSPAEHRASWPTLSESECQRPAPGIDFLTERDTQVTSFEVKMHDSVQRSKDCSYFPKYVDNRPFKEQATQTLYRESSAQTVAYLPEVYNKEQVEHLELFNLSTLLPGDQPPGLHEVEVVERARKRWAFTKALKTNFMQQLQQAREQAMQGKYRPILEAFEWEQWMEREEYIQECQMMRLEIVIRMFDKREKEMQAASKSRIELACATIEQRRQRGLQKNEIQYQRALRRLVTENQGISRRWKKQTPMQSLGSPCSEFYAPLRRHGVDPARRNFTGGDGRKAFDMRIDELEKRVNMERLECPFSKLKEWSKPKEHVKEYEQHFCSDKHLQKLYESLKALRTQATKQKTAPRCLKRRPKQSSEGTSRLSFTYHDVDAREFFKSGLTDAEEHVKQILPEQQLAIEKYLKDEKLRLITPGRAIQMVAEQQSERLEQLLHMHEGTTTGWIMQFLTEEMERLKEQRKLHLFTILAQKERWRREAAEAGLRQKENTIRQIYEDVFQQTNLIHTEIAEEYITNILTTDMSHIADHEAADAITAMAKQIDREIKRWLEDFRHVQTPLTYEPLRTMLAAMITPDLGNLLIKYEKELIVKYIIDDILFPRVWNELESYDITHTLTSDMIDRLTDNDLYIFTTSESEGDGETVKTSQKEANAIIRKVIRQAVPGRRWKTEEERIAHETYRDLFDDIFDHIIARRECSEPIDLCQAVSRQAINKTDNIRQVERSRIAAKSEMASSFDDRDGTVLLRTQILSMVRKLKEDKVTKVLDSQEQYIATPEDIDGDWQSEVIQEQIYRTASRDCVTYTDVHSIVSRLDITKETDFKPLRQRARASQAQSSTSTYTSIGVYFGEKNTQTKQDDQIIGALKELLGENSTVEPTEVSMEYEADDERSWFNLGSEQDEIEEDDIGKVAEEEVEEEEILEFRLTGIPESAELLEQPKEIETVIDIKEDLNREVFIKHSEQDMMSDISTETASQEELIRENRHSILQPPQEILIKVQEPEEPIVKEKIEPPIIRSQRSSDSIIRRFKSSKFFEVKIDPDKSPSSSEFNLARDSLPDDPDDRFNSISHRE